MKNRNDNKTKYKPLSEGLGKMIYQRGLNIAILFTKGSLLTKKHSFFHCFKTLNNLPGFCKSVTICIFCIKQANYHIISEPGHDKPILKKETSQEIAHLNNSLQITEKLAEIFNAGKHEPLPMYRNNNCRTGEVFSAGPTKLHGEKWKNHQLLTADS